MVGERAQRERVGHVVNLLECYRGASDATVVAGADALDATVRKLVQDEELSDITRVDWLEREECVEQADAERQLAVREPEGKLGVLGFRELQPLEVAEELLALLVVEEWPAGQVGAFEVLLHLLEPLDEAQAQGLPF